MNPGERKAYVKGARVSPDQGGAGQQKRTAEEAGDRARQTPHRPGPLPCSLAVPWGQRTSGSLEMKPGTSGASTTRVRS